MAVIELKNIDKFYGKGLAKVEALKDVNFKANKGEVVLIMGPGKNANKYVLQFTCREEA